PSARGPGRRRRRPLGRGARRPPGGGGCAPAGRAGHPDRGGRGRPVQRAAAAGGAGPGVPAGRAGAAAGRTDRPVGSRQRSRGGRRHRRAGGRPHHPAGGAPARAAGAGRPGGAGGGRPADRAADGGPAGSRRDGEGAGGGPVNPVWRLARPYLPRLVATGLLAAGADLAGVVLLATATWLLVTAAGQPPVAALTVAIVMVRGLAVSRGVLRYTERLGGHDAVLRVLTEVRARMFAALAASTDPTTLPARAGTAGRSREQEPVLSQGDALSRVVSDVEAVQDALLRVLVPGAAAALVGLLTVGGAAVVTPVAAGVLAAGLLIAGVGLPAAAIRLMRRRAARLAPLRGELAADTVDLTRGAAELMAFGAMPGALARAGRRAGRLARAETRLGTAGMALDAAGTLVAGATAAGVVLAATAAGAPGVWVAALTVGAMGAVEACLGLLAAARTWTRVEVPLRRVGAVLAAAPPESEEAATGAAPAEAPVGPVTLRGRGLHLTYRPDAPPALAGVDIEVPPGRRIAIVGPSGAGKSTLLRVLAGLLPADAGTVTVTADGVTRSLTDWPEPQRRRIVGGLLADPH